MGGSLASNGDRFIVSLFCLSVCVCVCGCVSE